MVYASYSNLMLIERGELNFMKSVAEVYLAERPAPSSTNSQEASHSVRSRYFLSVVLIAAMYLLSSWALADEPATPSFTLTTGFLFFWLAGGCITLIVLGFSAKKSS